MSRPVLVVDDDPSLRRMVSRMLESSGLSAVAASSPEQAMSALRAIRPSAVVLDAYFPGETAGGLDLLALLKSGAETQDIPVLVLTGAFADEEIAGEARALGADGIAYKPVDPGFAKRLRELIDRPAALTGTVVVYDDEPEWADLAAKILRAEGHEVYVSPAVDQLPKLCAERRADCVLIDYDLGKVTAEQLAPRLRDAEATLRPIPIVVMSALPERAESSVCAFADRFVDKAKPATLAVAVLAALRGSGLRQRGDLRLDPKRASVTLSGQPQRLSGDQFALLSLLMDASPNWLSRARLTMALEGRPYDGESRALDQLASRLRKSLGSPAAERIQSSKADGFRLL